MIVLEISNFFDFISHRLLQVNALCRCQRMGTNLKAKGWPVLQATARLMFGFEQNQFLIILGPFDSLCGQSAASAGTIQLCIFL
jgi:hypothetical protein